MLFTYFYASNKKGKKYLLIYIIHVIYFYIVSFKMDATNLANDVIHTLFVCIKIFDWY